MPSPHEGDPGWWNSIASTLDQAKFSVWSVDPARYDETTEEVVEKIVTLGGTVRRPPRTILDVGCGIGRLTIPMKVRFPAARVVGLDPAEKMLEHALEADSSIEWILGSGADAKARGVTLVDLAYSVVTFQHNARYVCAAIVESVAAILAPGGRFVYQYVGDSAFEDEGHVPAPVAEQWAVDAGLFVTARGVDAMFPDWIWTVAEKP